MTMNLTVKATGRWMDFLNDESGQDQIEYALVAALLSLGAVASLRSVSTSIAAAWNQLGPTFAAAI
jgi:pilus assembly protein Flp/PilA